MMLFHDSSLYMKSYLIFATLVAVLGVTLESCGCADASASRPVMVYGLWIRAARVPVTPVPAYETQTTSFLATIGGQTDPGWVQPKTAKHPLSKPRLAVS